MPVADVNVGLRRFPWLLEVGARQRRGSGQGSANTRMNGICLNVMMNTSGSVTIQRIEVASMPLRIIWLERLLLRLGAMQHFKRHCQGCVGLWEVDEVDAYKTDVCGGQYWFLGVEYPVPPRPLGHSSSPGSIQFIVFSTTFIMMPTPNLDLTLSVRECEYSTSTFHRGVRGFWSAKLSAELTRSSRS